MNIQEFKQAEDYIPSSELESYEGMEVELGPRVIDLDTCRWARPVLLRVDGKSRKLGCVPCKQP